MNRDIENLFDDEKRPINHNVDDLIDDLDSSNLNDDLLSFGENTTLKYDDEYVRDDSLTEYTETQKLNIKRLKEEYEKDKLDEPLKHLSSDSDDSDNYDEPLKHESNDKKDLKPEKKPKKKMKLWQKIVVTLICLFIILGSGFGFLLYGPYPNFRQWLITTAMTTMRHQYLAKWFYNDKTINAVMKKNYVKEAGNSTDLKQITFVDYSKSNGMYKNKYEKEILSHDKNSSYKLINITGDGMRGYLVAIYDASKVKIATSDNMSVRGEMLVTMAKKNKAVVAMNASGFSDPNYMGNGANPHGMVIKNGVLVSNLSKNNQGGGLIGFTKENKLIFGKMTYQQAVQKGVRDAMEFGPYLIVNGVPSFIKGNGGWGTAPRSAIGQRQDGIVLFLVMDGRDYAHGIDGVGMVELTEILAKYGAYNAANMDGGTSSGLVINGELINKPVNGNGQKSTRAIPDAWIVTE
jgi:exopolysaccharide biosynthesis protein